MVSLLLTHALLLSSALAAPLILERQDPTCPQSHLIIARGSLEPQGPGQLMTMATKIMATNPGTTMDAVVYPATIDNYTTSVATGTAAFAQMFGDFMQKCPQAKVALMGYSQGAQVIGDAIGGGGIAQSAKMTPPISRALSDKADAIIFYGDPRHSAVASYNVGNATQDGIFIRPANQSISAFSTKLQSYCNVNDPFCASGNDIKVHLAYAQQFDDAAATFVSQKFQQKPQAGDGFVF